MMPVKGKKKAPLSFDNGAFLAEMSGFEPERDSTPPTPLAGA
jgi:hypothetical protein